MDKLFANASFLRYALNAIPSIVVVADGDARIHYRNTAGCALLKGERIYGDRIGHVMHCLYSDNAAGGCGHGARCSGCALRSAVNAVFEGKSVRRQKTELSIKGDSRTLTVPALISASALTFEGGLYALLVIEDISELTELRSLLPICSGCKKIRREDGRWESVETYLRSRLPDSRLSHGLCPDCVSKLYPGHSD